MNNNPNTDGLLNKDIGMKKVDPTDGPANPLTDEQMAKRKADNKKILKWGGGAVAILFLLNTCGGKDPEPAPAPATVTATATSAPAAQTTTSAPATQTTQDTAGSVISRMDCQNKVLTKKQLDANALIPSWAESAKSVAGCTVNDFNQVIVAEYATKDDALIAIAQAQKSQGWHNRVTVDGRFARGVSGKDWSSIDFPKINQEKVTKATPNATKAALRKAEATPVQRKADESEAQRKADAQRKVDAQRKADAQRKVDAQRKADAQRKVEAETQPVQRWAETQPSQTTQRKAETQPKTGEAAQGAYYKNCAAARNAGVAPIHSGEPGYRSGLDRDGDGVACDS